MKSNVFILIIACLALCIVLFSCKEKEPSDFRIEWTCVTESAPWAPRICHTSVVLNNKIWIIGGYYNGVKSDVWFSADGMKWVCATESAAWSPRCEHTSIVFDNKI